MTAPASRTTIERAHKAVMGMEDDIDAVANTAKLLAAIAASRGMIDCDALSVFGTLLREHADYLREAFTEAHRIFGELQ